MGSLGEWGTCTYCSGLTTDPVHAVRVRETPCTVCLHPACITCPALTPICRCTTLNYTMQRTPYLHCSVKGLGRIDWLSAKANRTPAVNLEVATVCKPRLLRRCVDWVHKLGLRRHSKTQQTQQDTADTARHSRHSRHSNAISGTDRAQSKLTTASMAVDGNAVARTCQQSSSRNGWRGRGGRRAQ